MNPGLKASRKQAVYYPYEAEFDCNRNNKQHRLRPIIRQPVESHLQPEKNANDEYRTTPGEQASGFNGDASGGGVETLQDTHRRTECREQNLTQRPVPNAIGLLCMADDQVTWLPDILYRFKPIVPNFESRLYKNIVIACDSCQCCQSASQAIFRGDV